MKVKELLTDESRWCKNCAAVDKNGIIVNVFSPKACKWCLEGALLKCYPGLLNYIFYENILKILEKLSNKVMNLSAWNDAEERTFQDVKDLVEELDI